jgi:hypothetical protein
MCVTFQFLQSKKHSNTEKRHIETTNLARTSAESLAKSEGLQTPSRCKKKGFSRPPPAPFLVPPTPNFGGGFPPENRTGHMICPPEF